MSNSDVDAIARTIYGESRGEGKIGMQAVTNTIMNRVAKQTWYGLTPFEVCHKKWQYSCWNSGDPNLPIIQEADDSIPVFVDAKNIAGKAVAGELEDITNGATHYYDKRIPTPDWAEGKEACAAIGHHLFFNNIG